MTLDFNFFSASSFNPLPLDRLCYGYTERLHIFATSFHAAKYKTFKLSICTDSILLWELLRDIYNIIRLLSNSVFSNTAFISQFIPKPNGII